MLKRYDSLTQNQLLAISFSIILSGSIRPLLGILAGSSGEFSWISVLLAIVPLSVLTVFMTRLMKSGSSGDGLGELFLRALGSAAGRGLLTVYTLWLIFFDVVIIRSSAERLVDMVYPDGNPIIFFVVLLALSAITATGKTASLGRLAETFRFLMLGTVIIILIMGLMKIDFKAIIPYSGESVGPISLGALSTAGIVGVIVYLSFLEGGAEPAPGRTKSYMLEMCLALILVAVIAAETIGHFGAHLTQKLYCPFFLLMRDISFTSTLERIDVVVVAVWLITDFIFASALLTICAKNTSLIFKLKRTAPPALIAAAAVLAVSLSISPTAFMTQILAQELIVWINPILIYLVLPLVFIIGKLRKTLN